MEYVADTITGTTHTATIHYDHDCPIEDALGDTVGLMAAAPRDYYTQRRNQYSAWDKDADTGESERAYYRFGVNVIEGSYQTLRYERITPGFLPPDTLNQYDLIYYTTRKRAEIMHSGPKTTSAQIWEAMEIDLREYRRVMEGDVYGIVITHNETGEDVDSCWRFIGWEYAESEARAMLENAEAYYQSSEFDTYPDNAA